MKPGEYFYNFGQITLNKGRRVAQLKVKNTDVRPVQIGSHFHFFEVNKALLFDRKIAFGMRLDIPSGAAVRFEPGEEKEVNLVSLGGLKNVYGLNGLTNGNTASAKAAKNAFRKAKSKGFMV
jgi:urease subunit beta/urease subunit gamma/beta